MQLSLAKIKCSNGSIHYKCIYGDCGAKILYLPCINNGCGERANKKIRDYFIYFTKPCTCIVRCAECVSVCLCVYDSFALIFLLNHMVQSLCVTSLAFGKIKFMHYLHLLCFHSTRLLSSSFIFQLGWRRVFLGIPIYSVSACACVDAFDVHDIQ